MVDTNDVSVKKFLAYIRPTFHGMETLPGASEVGEPSTTTVQRSIPENGNRRLRLVMDSAQNPLSISMRVDK